MINLLCKEPCDLQIKPDLADYGITVGKQRKYPSQGTANPRSAHGQHFLPADARRADDDSSKALLT